VNRRAFLFSITVAASGHDETTSRDGWRIRFRKVHDILRLYAGAPPSAPLIAWNDRGKSGGATWTWKDRTDEIRSIGKWVKATDKTISLYGEITKGDEGTGDQLCELEVFYKKDLIAKWEFNSVSARSFTR
jgi:hypothetical protein